ncbi:lateral flagellin LafA [Aeromonas piscicola]|uniref:Flagellin n=2 Tax=Aeromonas TaxID=642 RepID=A0AAW7IAE3_9GAMM|nr:MULTISPECIES: lateral flagellin LafA [Aeromonas]MCH7348169.1 lateral flagellin LafA [Aeromonas sp. MR7]MDM5132422.1 lateral flagellin LafA [Aeromonas piscicola]MDM5140807.1 lateral flagellin LafA [Aeromonas bestiarum]POG22672.1 Lateral flagellin [Aeromonas bestiarum]
MGLSIHTNFASMTTQNQLNSTNKMLGTAMQRLGTGLRINSAADDAAGLQIATRLQAQSNGQKVGMRNAQDAISMIQTAEGAMDEMTNITQRMKDLATQAANGTNSTKDLDAMDAEFKELGKELGNIRDNTTFGGTSLLKTGGKFQATGGVTFQIGASVDEKLVFDASTKVTSVNTAISTASTAALTTGAAAQITAMDSMLEKIGEARSAFGANINRLEHTVNNLSNMKENTDMANGRIMDADFAQESTNMTKNQMLMQAGMSVLSNSNQMTGMVTGLLR